MENSIPCDIVLLPNEELAQKAISASQLLASHDSLFTLELGKFFPHLSLYMFQLNPDDIPRVDDVLKTMASTTNPILASAKRYFMADGDGVGYVDPEYEATDDISRLQNRVVEAVNSIRAGMRQKDIARMKQAKGLKLENFQRYGYAAIGELFRPHMTLARLSEYKPEVLDALPTIGTFSGIFDRLGLFEMGDNGTCVRKIREFELQA